MLVSWQQDAPRGKQTKGYSLDARWFWEETEEVRRELGIEDGWRVLARAVMTTENGCLA